MNSRLITMNTCLRCFFICLNNDCYVHRNLASKVPGTLRGQRRDSTHNAIYAHSYSLNSTGDRTRGMNVCMSEAFAHAAYKRRRADN